jgi:hypothetical protein
MGGGSQNNATTAGGGDDASAAPLPPGAQDPLASAVAPTPFPTASSEAALEGATPIIPGGGPAAPQTGPIPMPTPAPGQTPAVGPGAGGANAYVPPPGAAPGVIPAVGPGGGVRAGPPNVGPGGGAPEQPGAWNGIFGRDPRAGPWYKDPKVLAVGMGSLGEGLKSVGQNWNKPKFAAMAGSAGSAIEGGNKAEDTFFKKSREAAEDVMKAYALEDRAKLNASLIKFQEVTGEAKAAALRDHGTIASRAADWRNSDNGKLSMADNIAQKQSETLRKSMEGRLDPNKNPDPVSRAAAEKEFHEKEKELYAKAYERYKWKPEDVEKIRKRGQPVYGSDGKIDIKATMEQAHTPKNRREWNLIPEGQFYRDPNDGKLYRHPGAPPPADAPRWSSTANPGPNAGPWP